MTARPPEPVIRSVGYPTDLITGCGMVRAGASVG